MKKRVLQYTILLMCFFFLSASAAEELKQENGEIKTHKIGIIRTNAPYAVEQEEGLKQGLENLGYGEGRNIIYLPTKIVGSDMEDFPKNTQMSQELLAQNPDIVATIGTQASVPVWPVVEKTNIPMVFAGVTYPVEGGLIEAFGKPTGKNITGISYGVPPITRLELFRKMFPDTDRFKKIGFVYNTRVPQEVIYVESLENLTHTAGWKILFIDLFDKTKNEVSSELLLERLKQQNVDVIFGWFSLDQLSANIEEFRKLLKIFNKPVLGITSKFTDEGAIGGVLTNHFALGTWQAKAIDKIIKGEKAGSIPPAQPTEYLIELNLKKAEELGIEFELELIAASDRIVK